MPLYGLDFRLRNQNDEETYYAFMCVAKNNDEAIMKMKLSMKKFLSDEPKQIVKACVEKIGRNVHVMQFNENDVSVIEVEQTDFVDFDELY